MDLQAFFAGRAKLDHDVIRAYYRDAGDNNCLCAGCRNFVALAKARRLPSEVLELLDALDIRPEQATDVCAFPTETRDRLPYQVCYRLAGTLLTSQPVAVRYNESSPYAHRIQPPRSLRISENIKLTSGGLNPPVPDFPAPFVDLELWYELPWVLDESNNYLL